jgi:hypothetical protein
MLRHKEVVHNIIIRGYLIQEIEEILAKFKAEETLEEEEEDQLYVTIVINWDT